MKHATLIWLVVGLITSGLTFFAGAVTQFAAGNSVGQLSNIVLLQLAGSFFDHFIPFSFGGIDLTARYYQKHGIGQTKSITMGIIPIIFGVITTVIIIAIISPITLVHLAGKIHVSHIGIWLTALIIILVIAGFFVYKYRRRVLRLVTDAAAAIRGIQNTRQLLLLVSGSAAVSFLSASVLYASIRSVHATISIVGAFVIYITASLVSNIAPTPGGIGAIEAVLVVSLAATGLSLPQAAAATVVFRLLTFWLPIIPGALALHRLNRQKTV